ncbi:MAG: ABC transporter ATP-binding protein [Streptosporangiaceae bacterium]
MLAVGAGEVMAFLGPNGAGKTSTIDMILGLSRPAAGAVQVYGMAPRQAVRKGLVAAVMQTGGLLKDLTVAERVQYTARLFAVSRPVAEVLERAGITAIAGRRVGKCSGGEQQRLRFAMALIPDPELLILDEPTRGMDVEGRRAFWTAIREDATRGQTIIFATHYLAEADAYADRIVLISKGKIVADGTAAQVKGLASGRMIRATLPGADETALRAIRGVDGVEVRGDTVLIHCGDSDAVAGGRLQPGDRAAGGPPSAAQPADHDAGAHLSCAAFSGASAGAVRVDRIPAVRRLRRVRRLPAAHRERRTGPHPRADRVHRRRLEPAHRHRQSVT